MIQKQILIIDDLKPNREVLRGHVISWGHQAHLQENGATALVALQQPSLPDLIICDVLMPEMDGITFLQKVKEDIRLRDIPILMVSAVDEMDIVVQCLEAGADDYLFKPFNSLVLKARINACLQKKETLDQERRFSEQIKLYNATLEDRVKEGVKQIAAAQMGTIFALSKLAESRDPETGAHLDRMREYCVILARELQKNLRYKDVLTDAVIDNIYVAAPLHDIGKVGVPDAVLLKPGRLTEDEFDVIKTHTTIGEETMQEVSRTFPGNLFLEVGKLIASGHHEKWDGSGYPRGLAGEDIPLVCRLVALGDVYDALTSKRCYKEAFSHEKSREIILLGSGKHFDPEVVNAFLNCESQFLGIRDRIQD